MTFRSVDAMTPKAAMPAYPEWRPIETAPKDGTEILAWRDDCGVLLVRWTCMQDFMTTSECEDFAAEVGDGADEMLETYDWFFSDFVRGGRLEGSEVPVLWLPLPGPPTEALAALEQQQD